MPKRSLAAFAALALFACHRSSESTVPKGADLLYDVSFSAPEQSPGQPVATWREGKEQTFPSRVPSSLFFGQAMVVDKACGLEQQPVQLTLARATQGMEGLQFLLDERHAHYHVELDLCVAEIGAPTLPAQKVQLGIFFDFADAYELAFMEGGDIGVVDPVHAAETVANPKLVARWVPGKPLHLAFDLDSEAQRWQIAIDGKQVYDAPLQITIPRAVRVLLRGNPRNEAAFDNFKVWAEREIKVEGLEPPVPNPENTPGAAPEK